MTTTQEGGGGTTTNQVKFDEEAPQQQDNSNNNNRKKFMTKNNKGMPFKEQERSLFPTPKQVVTVYCPIVHVVTQEVNPDDNNSGGAEKRKSEILSEYVNGVWDDFATTTEVTTRPVHVDGEKKPHKKKIRRVKIKMGSLLLKSLTRLVKQNVIAYDRVFLSKTSDHLLVRILAGDRTVPILLMRFERIGVGTVVGAAFGTPLEWSHAPPVTAKAQQRAISKGVLFDLSKINAVSAMPGAGQAYIGGISGGSISPSSTAGARGASAATATTTRTMMAGSIQSSGSSSNNKGSKEDGKTMDLKSIVSEDETEEVAQEKNKKDDDNDEDEDEEAEEVSISSDEDEEEAEREAAEIQRFYGAAAEAAKKTTDNAVDVVRKLVTGKSNKDLLQKPEDTKSVSDVGSSITKIQTVTDEKIAELTRQIADARREWLETGSRLRVAQVLEDVTAGAAFTFDYLCYVLLAAWVAAMGLISNSVAVVVASMLLSPLMGPCLGSTMGFTLRDYNLVRLGIRNECISLILCVIMGMVAGLIAIPASGPAVQNWPSGEMTSRGTVNGLVMGIFVAVPSGMGVALSVLGRNSGGLTGVAISLSLLPPATNAGLCWMAAILFNAGIGNRPETDTTDYATVGLLSLSLTLVNICCIWIGGCFMFYLKEVAPIEHKNTFWSRDVKIAKQDDNPIDEIKPDKNIIKEGVNAALELEDYLATEGNLHFDNNGIRQSQIIDDKLKIQEERRRGLAANNLEDALFLTGANVHSKMDIIPGGAIDAELLPDEVTFLDDNMSDISSDKASLLNAVDKVGGLEQAGELLFSPLANKATANKATEWDKEYVDYGINHQDVAGAVLLS